MNIGILGSGDVARSLAAGFSGQNHKVSVGSRDPQKLSDWAKTHAGVSVGTFEETAKSSELVVLAVKGTAASDVLRMAGADNLAGKVVMDATNPIADVPPVNGVLQFFTSMNESLMEKLQDEFPDAKFVKAFNSVGNALMVKPNFNEGPPTMFICGNDESARQTVASLTEQLGWDVADMGQAESARAIEPLCMLWCIPGFADNDWNHAFKLIRV